MNGTTRRRTIATKLGRRIRQNHRPRCQSGSEASSRTHKTTSTEEGAVQMCRPQFLAAECGANGARRRAKRWESAARVEPVKLALQLDPARNTGPCKDMGRFCRAVANTRHHGARAADMELAILMDPGGLRGTRGTRGSLLSTCGALGRRQTRATHGRPHFAPANCLAPDLASG